MERAAQQLGIDATTVAKMSAEMRTISTQDGRFSACRPE
jgi:hypothetical protein